MQRLERAKSPSHNSGADEYLTQQQTRDILNPNIKTDFRPSAPIKNIKIVREIQSQYFKIPVERKSNVEEKVNYSSSDEHQPELLADDQTQNGHQRQQSKTTVVIAGDSIIKYIKDGSCLMQIRNVSAKSFSGAAVDGMSDFLKPLIRKHPSKLAIHAGTGDIPRLTPKIIADKVTELADKFKKASSNTKIIISSQLQEVISQNLQVR